MALQIGNAACVLGIVSDRDAFEEITCSLFFLPLYHSSFKKISTGRLHSGWFEWPVGFFVTGIVAGMGSPTFVADNGCVSSPPNMIHMALD